MKESRGIGLLTEATGAICFREAQATLTVSHPAQAANATHRSQFWELLFPV